MAFKMKGHSLPGINQRSDAKKGSSAFQKHDGKKFGDEGFMDTHFPSGAKRSAMKNITGVTHVHDDGSVHGPKKEHRPLEKPPTKMYGKKSPAKAHKEGHGERIRATKKVRKNEQMLMDNFITKASGPEKSRMTTSEMKPTKRFKPLKPTIKERVKKGLKKDSPAKLVGKTIKKIKAKRAAKKEMKKSGKGQVVTSVATAAMKMYGKKSAMKRVGTMSDAAKSKAEKARVKKAYLQYQAKQVAALERGDEGIRVMTFTQYKDKMGS